MSDDPDSHRHAEVLESVNHGSDPQPTPAQVFEALVWAGSAAPDLIRGWLDASGIVRTYH